jgi:phage shock protein A
MIEREILDEIKDELLIINQEIADNHTQLEDIEYNFSAILNKETSVEFDYDDLELLKENIQNSIIKLQELVDNIDKLDF